jgi:hypothetical protein
MATSEAECEFESIEIDRFDEYGFRIDDDAIAPPPPPTVTAEVSQFTALLSNSSDSVRDKRIQQNVVHVFSRLGLTVDC